MREFLREIPTDMISDCPKDYPTEKQLDSASFTNAAIRNRHLAHEIGIPASTLEYVEKEIVGHLGAVQVLNISDSLRIEQLGDNPPRFSVKHPRFSAKFGFFDYQQNPVEDMEGNLRILAIDQIARCMCIEHNQPVLTHNGEKTILVVPNNSRYVEGLKPGSVSINDWFETFTPECLSNDFGFSVVMQPAQSCFYKITSKMLKELDQPSDLNVISTSRTYTTVQVPALRNDEVCWLDSRNLD